MTGGEMETQLEECSFFDKYWPAIAANAASETLEERKGKDEEPASKWPRVEQEKGDGRSRDTRGKGRNHQGGHKRHHTSQDSRASQWDGWHQHQHDRSRDAPSYELMVQIQRLLLRHEDCLSLIKAEYGFVMFFRIDVPCSVIKPLFAAQKQWRDTKASDPTSLSKPMRTTLMACLVKELRQRVEKLQNPDQKDSQSNLVKMGWLKAAQGEDPCWSFLRLDSVKKAQVVDESREGLPHAKVVSTLAAIDALISIPDTLQRFHPTRPLVAEMSGTVLPFCLQTGMRTDEADRLNTYLRELSHNACTQLIAMSMRPERAQRSALAQLIAKQLG